LHVLINALSTMLLSSSNYTTQVLNAPTREDLDVAHAKEEWLDIGRLSNRNLRAIPPSRTMLCLVLVLSSTPLHMLYVLDENYQGANLPLLATTPQCSKLSPTEKVT
jgi:hypothetical protein